MPTAIHFVVALFALLYSWVAAVLTVAHLFRDLCWSALLMLCGYYWAYLRVVLLLHFCCALLLPILNIIINYNFLLLLLLLFVFLPHNQSQAHNPSRSCGSVRNGVIASSRAYVRVCKSVCGAHKLQVEARKFTYFVGNWNFREKQVANNYRCNVIKNIVLYVLIRIYSFVGILKFKAAVVYELGFDVYNTCIFYYYFNSFCSAFKNISF